MSSDSFRELRKLSTAWHGEVGLLRDMAKQAPTILEKHNLTVMANTYSTCAAALDEILGENIETEKPLAMTQHA